MLGIPVAQWVIARPVQHKAAADFSAILEQVCRPQSDYDYLMAATKLGLAGIRLGQRRFEDAARLLAKFKSQWPKADPGLTLVKDAEKLVRLLPQ